MTSQARKNWNWKHKEIIIHPWMLTPELLTRKTNSAVASGMDDLERQWQTFSDYLIHLELEARLLQWSTSTSMKVRCRRPAPVITLRLDGLLREREIPRMLMWLAMQSNISPASPSPYSSCNWPSSSLELQVINLKKPAFSMLSPTNINTRWSCLLHFIRIIISFEFARIVNFLNMHTL